MRKAHDTELAGLAMPAILMVLRAMLVGETIQQVGYLIDDDGAAWPTIETDNHCMVIQSDDEGNRPGAAFVSGHDNDGKPWSQIMPAATVATPAAPATPATVADNQQKEAAVYMLPDGSILEDVKNLIPSEAHFTGALHDHDHEGDDYSAVRYEHQGQAYIVLTIKEVDNALAVIAVVPEPPHTSGETLSAMLTMARLAGEYWQA